MDNMRGACEEVDVYAMGRPGFLLQHVADAFTVQTASADTKAITVVLGLVGLYLHVEKQFSGGEVQKVHEALGRTRREWQPVNLPADRGSMTVADVLAATAGTERDRAIDEVVQICVDCLRRESGHSH